MKRLKAVWYAIVAILCFLLVFGAILFCLSEWGGSEKYQGGVLVWNEQSKTIECCIDEGERG